MISDERKAELRRRCPTPEEVDGLLDEIADLRQRLEDAEERYYGLRETRQQEVRATEQWRDRCRTLEAALRDAELYLDDAVIGWRTSPKMNRVVETLAPQPPAQDGEPADLAHMEEQLGWRAPAHQPAAQPRSGESDEASGDEALEAFDMLVEEVERRCGVGVTQHEPDDEPHLDALYYFVRQALRSRQQSQVPDIEALRFWQGFGERAITILHNMAQENSGRFRLRRWPISDEPLRNDAARLLREYGLGRILPADRQYVGDDALKSHGEG